jgi:hypothetical protein
LDPGEWLEGWRASALQFLEEAGAAADAADWIGAHAYWDSRESLEDPRGGRWYEHVIERFPGKRLVITAFANPAPDVSPQAKAAQYLDFLKILAEEPAVGAALCSCLSAASGFESVVWRSEAGEDRGIADRIGERRRTRGTALTA